MLYTTVPAFMISLILYTILGLRYSADSIDRTAVDQILSGISNNFNVSPLYALIGIIPMLLVIILGVKQVNAVITMILAGITAMVIAIVFQGHSLLEIMSFMDGGYVTVSYTHLTLPTICSV